jgi:hypothetical protein
MHKGRGADATERRGIIQSHFFETAKSFQPAFFGTSPFVLGFLLASAFY